MNQWLAESIPNQQNNHAGFGASNDQMAFMQPASINPAQFQNQQFVNGASRNPTPSFHNPVYNVNSIVPSKRPREESIGTSPRQASGNLPVSRSDTPGAYPGYNPNINGGPQFPNAPNAYQHLQSGNSSTASPSPTIQQLNFSQINGQRLNTSSPSPFSPHNAPPQRSPAPSDHISRGATPHDSNNMMNSQSFKGQFGGQPFPMAGMPNGMQMNPALPQHMQPHGMSQQQRAMQMQQFQQRQMLQMAAQGGQGRPMSGGNNMMPGQTQNPQMAAMQQARLQMTQQMPKPNNPEQFIHTVQTFMAKHGRQVDVNPIICGRSIPLQQLYATVLKLGGSMRISKSRQWHMIAQQIGVPLAQMSQAVQELENYWTRNMILFENAWLQSKARNAQQGMNQQNDMRGQMSPGRNSQTNQSQAPMQTPQREAAKLNGQPGTPQHQINGVSQQSDQAKERASNTPSIQQHKPNLSQQLDIPQMNGMHQITTPSPQKRLESSSGKTEVDAAATMPLKVPIEETFKPEILPPSIFHGPIHVDEMYRLSQALNDVKPSVPQFHELGVIDIHALTMSIKSGIHAEVRLALDTMVTLSLEPKVQLTLENCDDLVESLIDCAQDQVDLLAENATEVSDEMLVTSYEDVVRACKVDAETLQGTPEFGSLDYTLNRAADKLICITTLIRNFSFYEANFTALGTTDVLHLMTNVIKNLGTKEMLLRSNRNTLDFMKDVVIYLSNLSHSIQLPGKEEALCLLHFLLAFAPCPHPQVTPTDKMTFATYNPNVHKYMPSAVDSLAKLLARDDPNRTFFRAIFAADVNSTPPYDLLTRSFGLAISPIPTGHPSQRQAVENRKPFLLQGMLAAEIISNLVPSSESGLAHSWLESTDGWAATLMRLIFILSELKLQTAKSIKHQQPGNRNQQHHSAESDPQAYGAISSRGLAVMKILVQKSRNGDDEKRLPAGVMPTKQILVGTLMQSEMEAQVVRQLCTYAGLEE